MRCQSAFHGACQARGLPKELTLSFLSGRMLLGHCSVDRLRSPSLMAPSRCLGNSQQTMRDNAGQSPISDAFTLDNAGQSPGPGPFTLAGDGPAGDADDDLRPSPAWPAGGRCPVENQDNDLCKSADTQKLRPHGEKVNARLLLRPR